MARRGGIDISSDDEEEESLTDDEDLEGIVHGKHGAKRETWLSRFKHAKDMHGKDLGCWGWYIMKWFWPGFLFALSFLFQNFCLHIATHYYIGWMERINYVADHALTGSGGTTAAHNYTSNATVSGHEQLSKSFKQGSLHDVAALYFGYHNVPTNALDSISVLIPGSWFVLVVYQLNLHLWTKCCFCGSLLAIGKGIFGFVTVLPDSIGWDACKKRLGPEGLKILGKDINFHEGFFWSLARIGSLKAFSYRYCADMVYSGHTYVCALFSVGLYDAWRRYTHFWKSKFLPRFALGCVLLAYVSVDVVLMLMNQFHYTLDVLLALLLVLLYYTNAAVARSTMWWAEEVWVEKGNRFEFNETSGTHFQGEIMVPPCCVPCCCLTGRYFLLKQNPHEELTRAVMRYDCAMLIQGDQATKDRFEAALQFHEDKMETNHPLRLIRDVETRLPIMRDTYNGIISSLERSGANSRAASPSNKSRDKDERRMLAALQHGPSSIWGTLVDQYHWYTGKDSRKVLRRQRS